MARQRTRRAVLGAAAVSATGLLAGCGGSSGDPAAGTDQSPVESYLESTTNYDGVQDETGSETVTVEVGSSANGGNFGFAPAAIRVDSGTTVRWVWSGEGSQHNVVAEDAAYESDLVADEGFEFEHTFESSGTSLYYCQPHKALGMKGAVVVE